MKRPLKVIQSRNQNFYFHWKPRFKTKTRKPGTDIGKHGYSVPDNGGHLVREERRFYRTNQISVGFDRRTDMLREVWETQDQLSPRHFENAGSNLFFYVECSYLVNKKPNYSRICWYKTFTVQNILDLLTCQFLRVVFSKASPDSDFLPKRLLASEIDKSIRIWLKFTTYYVLMSTQVCTKNY